MQDFCQKHDLRLRTTTHGGVVLTFLSGETIEDHAVTLKSLGFVRAVWDEDAFLKYELKQPSVTNLVRSGLMGTYDLFQTPTSGETVIALRNDMHLNEKEIGDAVRRDKTRYLWASTVQRYQCAFGSKKTAQGLKDANTKARLCWSQKRKKKTCKGKVSRSLRLGERDEIQAHTASMIEVIDCDGLTHLAHQLATQPTSQDFLTTYLDRIKMHFKTVIQPHSFGVPVMMLRCEYKTRHDMSGRLYSLGNDVGPRWGDNDLKSNVDVAGCPRELKGALLGRLAWDFDQANSQPEILRQMAANLTWSDGHSSPNVNMLTRYCEHRKAFIIEIAEFHGIFGTYAAQKDQVKPLIIAMCFGGSYNTWAKKQKDSTKRLEPVLQLQQELRTLRSAVFSSNEWAEWVTKDRTRQEQLNERRPAQSKKDTDDITRSVMARICQSEENRVLTTMRRFFKSNNFQTLSLVFDGLLVKKEVGRYPDLTKLSAQILNETGYTISIVEKPLFEGPWPPPLIISKERACLVSLGS